MKLFNFHDISSAQKFLHIKRPHLIIISFITACIFIIYTFLNFDRGYYFSNTIHAISAVLLLFISFIIYKNNISTSIYTLSSIFFLNLIILFAENVSRPELLIFFPMFSFIFLYILGYQKGLFITITFSAILVLVFFLEYEKSSRLSNITVFNSIASYLLVGLLSGIHSKFLDKQEKIFLSRSNYDQLTGIFNRRAFINHLFREFDFLKRKKNIPMSILLIDIDNFKSLNENFSQETGDNILITIKNIILENLRSTDFFARWSGEEFIIAALDTDKENAKLLADKIRKLVQEYIFETAGNLTLSIGISSYKEGDHFETLFQKSKNALTKAKDEGKNRVVLSD